MTGGAHGMSTNYNSSNMQFAPSNQMTTGNMSHNLGNQIMHSSVGAPLPAQGNGGMIIGG